MKTFACYLCVLMMAYPMQGLSDKGESSRKLTQESIITVTNRGQSAFETLIATVVDNRIPFGIVVDDRHYICQEHIGGTGRMESMTQFVNDLVSSMPTYTITFASGVLNVIPKKLNPPAERLLRINIPQFQSEADSHQGLGVNLWMYIRAVIAPKEGTFYAGASSTARETVNGIEVQNQDVRSILNTIVSKGNGGIWILKSDAIKDLSVSTPRPYELKGYVGEEQTILGLSCR